MINVFVEKSLRRRRDQGENKTKWKRCEKFYPIKCVGLVCINFSFSPSLRGSSFIFDYAYIHLYKKLAGYARGWKITWQKYNSQLVYCWQLGDVKMVVKICIKGLGWSWKGLDREMVKKERHINGGAKKVEKKRNGKQEKTWKRKRVKTGFFD